MAGNRGRLPAIIALHGKRHGKRECAELKGIFKGKQRRELQEQAERLKTQIANMKQHLSHIVQEYGYKNVKDFLAEYRASKAEFNDDQSAVAKWKQQTGVDAEPESVLDRLKGISRQLRSGRKTETGIITRRIWGLDNG